MTTSTELLKSIKARLATGSSVFDLANDILEVSRLLEEEEKLTLVPYKRIQNRMKKARQRRNKAIIKFYSSRY